MSQPDHDAKLKILQEDGVSRQHFVTQRARDAYIAAVGSSDLTFGFARPSQVLESNSTDIKFLNILIQLTKQNQRLPLRFVSIDSNSVRTTVFSVASFALNANLTSQLGFVITIADAAGAANIPHFSSVKSKGNTRSVLAGELYAAASDFEYAST